MQAEITDIKKEHNRRVHREWCQKNRDKRRASAAKFRLLHPEKVKKANKQWREQNRDYVRKIKAEYRNLNKVRISKKNKIYHSQRYRNDPDYRTRILNQTSLWAKSNRHKTREYQRNWRRRNLVYLALKGSKRRLVTKESSNDPGIKHIIKRISESVLVTCYYCNRIIDKSLMHLDHIFPLSRGGSHSSSNLCVSCNFCNMSKHNKTLKEWPKFGQLFLNL